MISGSALGSFVVTFLVRFLLGWLQNRQQSAEQRELGRVTEQRDAALDALDRQRELSDIAASRAEDSEIEHRLREGSA